MSVGWQWQTSSVDHDTRLQCRRKDGQGCRLSSQRFPSVTFGMACLPGGVLSPLILCPALSCMQISLKHWPPLAQLQVPCGCMFCMQNSTTKVFLSFQQAKNIHLQVKTGYCSPRLLTGTAQTWVMVVALYLTLVTAVSVATWQLEFTQERMVPC